MSGCTWLPVWPVKSDRGRTARSAAHPPPVPVQSAAMRRRIRSAALPLHRHSLPQIAVDGVLVALAYLLAYRLRFDGRAGPGSLPRPLRRRRSRRWSSARCSSSPSSGCTRSGGATSTQRDYMPILQAVVVATLLLPGYIAIVHPVTHALRPPATSPSRAPTGVIVLFLLLTLAFVGGTRFVARTIYERPLRGFRARAGRPRRADRRRRRRRPARAARDPAQPRPRPQARRLRRRRPDSSGGCGSTASACSARRASSAGSSTRSSRTRSRSRSRRRRASLRATRRARVPRARDPGPHAADGLRAAAERRATSVRQVRDVQVEDILGREPVRMELDRVGALPQRRGRARHRRRRLDRHRALAPDRARRAAPADPARPRRGQPLRDPARARGRPPRPPLGRSTRSSPTARRRSGCARSSPSTARPSSSTRPPTSTSA